LFLFLLCGHTEATGNFEDILIFRLILV